MGAPALPRRPHPRDPARVKRAEHRALWRAVEGAVVDAFRSHPEYFTEAGRKAVVRSVTKRVVGSILGAAQGARERGRPGAGGFQGDGAADADAAGGADNAAGTGAQGIVPAAGAGRGPCTRFPALAALLVGGA